VNKFSQIISALLSGKASIIIYILMFIYLVPVAIAGLIPGLEWIEPSANLMLIGDNYTSVLAALGASIAAGAGVATHKKLNDYKQNHQEMQASMAQLHEKIDKLSAK
jgi:hypothetical protein